MLVIDLMIDRVCIGYVHVCLLACFLPSFITAGRCNGAMVVVSAGERLGLDHLSPYLESSGVSFRHGANFAAAGAMAGAGGEDGACSKLFSLGTQVRQFRHFKSRTADLLRLGLGGGPGITREEFDKAVYTFDIGRTTSMPPSSPPTSRRSQSWRASSRPS